MSVKSFSECSDLNTVASNLAPAYTALDNNSNVAGDSLEQRLLAEELDIARKIGGSALALSIFMELNYAAKVGQITSSGLPTSGLMMETLRGTDDDLSLVSTEKFMKEQLDLLSVVPNSMPSKDFI